MQFNKSKVLRLFMSATLAFTIFGANTMGINAESLGSTIKLEESGNELETNVERGRCAFTWVNVDAGSCPVLWPSGGMYSIMYDLRYFSNGNDFTQEGYEKSTGCGGYKSLSEHPDFLSSLKETLQNARNSGTSIVLRFSYASDNTTGNEPSGAGEGDSKAQPNTDLIVKHIRELSTVINEYKDTVLAVECGMYGPWGEMHTSMYDEPQYYSIFTKAWLASLDKNIKVLVRAPKHLMAFYGYADKAAEFAAAIDNGSLKIDPRLGMYNDGYLGSSDDIGTFGAANEWPYITREKAVDLLQNMDTVPYGGELAYVTVDDLKANNSTIYDNHDIMGEFYRTHLSYLHNIKDEGQVLAGELGKQIVDANEIIPGLDKSDVAPYIGQSYQKYILDHMGYRLLVKKSELSDTVDSDGTFNMSGSIKNTGFGNFLTDKKAEVILKNGDDTYTADVDDFSAKELNSLATMNYDWNFTVPSDLTAGNWDVYIRIKNASDTGEVSKTGISFANPDCFDETLRANKIGTISIGNGAAKSSSTAASSIDDSSTSASTGDAAIAASSGSSDDSTLASSTDDASSCKSGSKPQHHKGHDNKHKSGKYFSFRHCKKH